jgi:tight adherence protein B
MLAWFRSTFEGAGLARYGLIGVTAVILAISVMFGLITGTGTGIPAFGISIGIGVAGFCLEMISMRAKARRRLLAALWPEVIDSLISAAAAGISIPESFAELSLEGPKVLRPHFVNLMRTFDSGVSMSQVLLGLKAELGEVHADRLIELTRVVIEAGGEGYVSSLKSQSHLTREDLALWGELESKQGWVSGTAKLAVAAPWLIVAMLSTRPENAAAYQSAEGTLILLVGLLVSIFAYRLINLLGGLTTAPRVFS